MCTSFAQADPTQVRRHPVAQRARFSTDQTAGGTRHCGLWWHRRACATGVALRLRSILQAVFRENLCHFCLSEQCCRYMNYSAGTCGNMRPLFRSSGGTSFDRPSDMDFRSGFRAEQLMHHIGTGVCNNQSRRVYNHRVLSWHSSTASCPTA